MARHKGAAAAGPLAVVASLGARGGRRRNGARSGAGAIADRARKVVTGPLPKGIAKRLPSRRKRKAMLRKAPQQLDRLSKMAGGVGTALTVAAAAAEVFTNIRGSKHPGPDQETGREDTRRAS